MAIFPFDKKHPGTLKRLTSPVDYHVIYSVQNVHRSSAGATVINFIAYSARPSNVIVAPKWSDDMGSSFTGK